MINLEFPSDPSKLQFVLDPSMYASVYLLARAAKHYGAKNIHAVHTMCSFNNIEDREQATHAHKIFDYLNVDGKCISIDGTCPGVFRNRPPKDEKFDVQSLADIRQLKQIIRNVIYEMNPMYHDIYNVKVSDSISVNAALRAVALFRHVNLIDDQFNVNTNGDYRAIVSPLMNSTSSIRRLFFLGPEMIDGMDTGKFPHAPWAPLTTYSTEDILQSAAEEQLLPAVTMTFTCQYGRPMHCGRCIKCNERRHTFIQADVEDNTRYEY